MLNIVGANSRLLQHHNLERLLTDMQDGRRDSIRPAERSDGEDAAQVNHVIGDIGPYQVWVFLFKILIG